ncbi:MAG: Stp1/IreP family PP2C-type Ser/Thr phosphatase [Myxococcales bacterium]|nr:Stp1/IreP family PP2C-type Ser/Thr phosphatase [Myxococcales bacterium]MBL0196342.1 Stp1/IreP family PP2C-type Ser/Thr phosphatase [Myxococcales bacterium]HQY65114.1 Stp1/IreP family PP2C-type Ser/Thr phosphatase [Polyangiaceae bacterium]
MATTDPIQFFAATDVGRVREHNEDNFLVDKKLQFFIVCDGMGGHAAGEVASAIAVRAVHEEVKKEREMLQDFARGSRGSSRVTKKEVLALLDTAVLRACAKVHEAAQNDDGKRGMGTTLSALLILGNTGFIAHVGDSRIYMERSGIVKQITEDHTVINELIRRGKLTEDQISRVKQKNAITRAVGVYQRVEVDTLTFELLPGDSFLLSSDGLTGYLDGPEELADYLLAEDGASAVKGLISLANERGGKDNITCILVHITGEIDDAKERAARVAQKREILAKMPIFARLVDSELMHVMQSVEVRLFRHGETVITEGEKGDELFIVLKGAVNVLRGNDELARFGVGDHFGEMALIRAVPRSATVVSDGASELMVIKRGDFFEILRNEHQTAVKILWQFLGVLADRLDQTNQELRDARRKGIDDEGEEIEIDDATVEIFPTFTSHAARR